MSKTNGKFCYVYDHNFLKKEQKDMLQVNISLGREGERQKGKKAGGVVGKREAVPQTCTREATDVCEPPARQGRHWDVNAGT